MSGSTRLIYHDLVQSQEMPALAWSQPVPNGTHQKEFAVEYNVYFVAREDEDLKFKADLFDAETKPQGAALATFEATNDKEAKNKVNDFVLPGDRRIVNGIGKLKLCRQKGGKGGGKGKGKTKVIVLLDLNTINEPLQMKLFEALSPLVESGDLIEDALVFRPAVKDMIKAKAAKKRKKKEDVLEEMKEAVKEKDEETAKEPEVAEVAEAVA